MNRVGKKYYVILCLITFLCCFTIAIVNMNPIVDFLIILIPNLIFHIIWDKYSKNIKI